MMEFMWYVVGVLAGLAGYLVYVLSTKYKLGIIGIGGLVVGLFLLLFTLAWTVGSILEGVPRAASMAIVFFAMPGIVVLTFTSKWYLHKRDKQETKP